MKENESKCQEHKTKEENLKIVKKASIHRVRETQTKYGVYLSTYYK